MNRSKSRHQWSQAAAAALIVGLTSGAFADYQHTLAARGADAFAPPSPVNTIELEDMDRAFSRESLITNPALSDQEVMIELQARIRAKNNLEMAALNLDPATSATTENSAGPSEAEDTPTAEAKTAEVAAR